MQKGGRQGSLSVDNMNDQTFLNEALLFCKWNKAVLFFICWGSFALIKIG